jgi:hypothetical protein
MSSGVSRVAVGAYVGTGALQEIKAEKIDFKPRKVEIHRMTTAIDKAEWVEGMDDDSMLLTTGSTGVRTLVTTAAIIPLTSGFSVGTAAQINNAGDTYRYVAWE